VRGEGGTKSFLKVGKSKKPGLAGLARNVLAQNGASERPRNSNNDDRRKRPVTEPHSPGREDLTNKSEEMKRLENDASGQIQWGRHHLCATYRTHDVFLRGNASSTWQADREGLTVEADKISKVLAERGGVKGVVGAMPEEGEQNCCLGGPRTTRRSEGGVRNGGQ